MERLLWNDVRDLWGDFYMFLKGVNLPNHRAQPLHTDDMFLIIDRGEILPEVTILIILNHMFSICNENLQKRGLCQGLPS